ncbi:MAG: hypothetical protein LBE09_07750 [Christensenellaceae bacterium]|jgi:hypothetical protein|nr:hypothetical protein [Christensenellaceae bacterium]
MKKSKGLFWLKVFAYVLGFPVLMAYTVYQSMFVIYDSNVGTDNTTYMPYVFAGLLVMVVIWLLYLLVALITGMITKRRKTARSAYIGTTVLVIASVILTTGVWFALDKYLPPILSSATSNTIHYSDLEEDYADRAYLHSEMLHDFIEMNIANARLDPAKAETYRSEGYQNEDVQKLIKESFQSIDNDAYRNWPGPLINLADGSRLTIPVLIHLLFDERAAPSKPFTNYVGEGRGEENKDAPIKWAILDMQQDVMSLDLNLNDLLGDLTGIVMFVSEGYFTEDYTGTIPIDDIMASLATALADENVLGAPIYIDMKLINAETGVIQIKLVPNSETRGVFDYKRMAWFDSNYLIVAIISIFPLRNAFYIFGVFVAISSLAIGIIRKSQYVGKGRSLKGAFSGSKGIPIPAQSTASGYGTTSYRPQVVDDSPYMRSYYASIDDYNSRNSQ